MASIPAAPGPPPTAATDAAPPPAAVADAAPQPQTAPLAVAKPPAVATGTVSSDIQAQLDAAKRDFEQKRKNITSKSVLRDKVLDFHTASIERIERAEGDGRNLIRRGWDTNLVDEARMPEALTAALKEHADQAEARARIAQAAGIAAAAGAAGAANAVAVAEAAVAAVMRQAEAAVPDFVLEMARHEEAFHLAEAPAPKPPRASKSGKQRRSRRDDRVRNARAANDAESSNDVDDELVKVGAKRNRDGPSLKSLRAECLRLKIPVSGTKKDLVARITRKETALAAAGVSAVASAGDDSDTDGHDDDGGSDSESSSGSSESSKESGDDSEDASRDVPRALRARAAPQTDTPTVSSAPASAVEPEPQLRAV